MEEVTDGFLEVLGKNGYILIFFLNVYLKMENGQKKGQRRD